MKYSSSTNFLLITIIIFFQCSCAHEHFSRTKRIHALAKSKSNISSTIVIDPGHGGTDGGAVGKRGLKEKQVAFDIALRMRRLIRGIMPKAKIILTRKKDEYVSLEDRVKIANSAKADIFISVHVNSSNDENARGFEVYNLEINSEKPKFTYYHNKSFDNERLAGLLSDGIIHQLNKKVARHFIGNRGINQASFNVLFVNMPAVLAEMFFISNPQEEIWLSKPLFRELCARGLVLGIQKFLEEKNRDNYVINE